MDTNPPISQQHTTGELPQQQTLKILSILWYVFAGLSVIGLCIGGLYIVLGLIAFNDPHMFDPRSPNDPPPEFFALLFTALGAAVAVISVIVGVLALFTASGLSRRRRFVLCVVTSAIICLSVPLGTVLGVFTLITLFNRGVKQTFNTARDRATLPAGSIISR